MGIDLPLFNTTFGTFDAISSNFRYQIKAIVNIFQIYSLVAYKTTVV